MASTIKNVSGDYSVKALNGVITLDAPDTVVTGNLTVEGTTTQINSTVTQIDDNVITVNYGATGATGAMPNSGIETFRGAFPRPSLRWNEAALRWEFSDVDGTTFHPMGVGPGGGLLAVVDDPAPQLGGNLDTNNFYISNAAGDFIDFQSPPGIKYSLAPAWLLNYAKLYADLPAGGGSGVFVVNTATVNDELVTKSKALAFSIIF